MKKTKLHTMLLLSIIILMVFFGCNVVFAENIDPDDDGSQYAYGENVGWLNLEPGGDGGPGVEVGDFELTGHMWGENIGWISLSCENTFSCGTVDYGVVNDGCGNLSGYAWGENVGWISFSSENSGSCGLASYGVKIDLNTGGFSGHAWGENIGWINFAPTTGGGVKTSWRNGLECAEISITDLWTLGGDVSSAADINESGHIVGSSETSSGDTHAFLIEPEDNDADGNPDTWYSGTNGINELMIDLGTLGGAYSYASDINNSAQVVGWSTNLSGESHAFLWEDLNANGLSDPGEMIDLGTLPGGTSSYARDINDLGQVVGYSNSHAFLWEDLNANGLSDPGEMIDLGTLGGDFSQAYGINNLGQIVGVSSPSFAVYHAFLITPDGGTWYRDTDPADGVNDLMLDLGTLSLPDSWAMRINDVSQVVGWIRSLVPVDIRPFLWTAESGMREIGTFGGPISLAMDINDLGQVVGYSDVQASGETHAFVWTENGGIIDLGTLGGPYSLASEIDQTGEHIVGTAETSTGERHAVLWTIQPNTSVGTDIEVALGCVGVIFDNVRTTGLTTVTESLDNPGPVMSGHDVVSPFYEISTTAVFEEDVTVSLRYDDSAIADETTLSVLHLEGDNWVDVTSSVDTAQNIIHGSVFSFSWFAVAAPISMNVEIDIKPGSDPNCFNINGHGVIPVAILGSADLDVRQVDASTCSLEGLSLKVAGKSNKLMAHVEDVNGDGYDDLILQIEDVDAAFEEGDTIATLTGKLLDGTTIEGSDTICIVP